MAEYQPALSSFKVSIAVTQFSCTFDIESNIVSDATKPCA